MALHALQPHRVSAHRGHAGGGDVGHHIGREVRRRVVQLVQQLFLHRAFGDAAARARGLGDGAVAVGVDLGDGVAQVGEARHILIARVGKVAACDLCAAFQQMPGHGGARQPVPVVQCPPVVRQRGAQHQRWVGHTATDHDLGACAQRIGNGLRADVGVGADDGLGGHGATQRTLQQRAVFGAAQVVALQHGNARAGQAQLGRQRVDAARGTVRVGRAKVADDAHAVRQALRQHGAQQVHQQGFITCIGVSAARELGERQRALGQGLEDEHRRLAAGDERLHHGQGRVGAVAREAGGAAHQQVGFLVVRHESVVS